MRDPLSQQISGRRELGKTLTINFGLYLYTNAHTSSNKYIYRERQREREKPTHDIKDSKYNILYDLNPWQNVKI